MKDTEEKTLAILREYQENSVAVAEQTAEILRGLQEGRPLPALFLLAMDALAKTTHTPLIRQQAAEDLVAVYGYGLREADVAAEEAKAVRGRLEKLERAADEEGIPADQRKNIARAITAHRRALDLLTSEEPETRGPGLLQNTASPAADELSET